MTDTTPPNTNQPERGRRSLMPRGGSITPRDLIAKIPKGTIGIGIWGLAVLTILVVGLGGLDFDWLFKRTNDHPPPMTAEQAAQVECITQALIEYTNARLVLLQQDIKAPLQPATTLARRRLQEQYCVRYAACVFPVSTWQFNAMFDSCLQDEQGESTKDH
jgi:hypothetical protein